MRLISKKRTIQTTIKNNYLKENKFVKNNHINTFNSKTIKKRTMWSSQSNINITHALIKETDNYFYIGDWGNELKKSKIEQDELKQSFVCNVCDESLIPKCGDIKTWHFSHTKSNIECPMKKINQHGKYVYVRNNFIKALIDYDTDQRNQNLPSFLKDYVFNHYKKDKVKSITVENVTRRMSDIMNTNTQECFNFLLKSKVPEKECLLKEKIFGQDKLKWIMSSFDYLNKNNQSFTPLYFMGDCNHPVFSVLSDYEKLQADKYLMVFTPYNLMFLKWEKVIEEDHINNRKSSSSMKRIIVQFKVDNTLDGLLNEQIRNQLKKRFLPLIHTYVTNNQNESLDMFDQFFSKPACFTLNNHVSCDYAPSFSCIKAKMSDWFDRQHCDKFNESWDRLESDKDNETTGEYKEIRNMINEVSLYLTREELFQLKKLTCQSFYQFISTCAWFMCVIPFTTKSEHLTFIGTKLTKESRDLFNEVEDALDNDDNKKLCDEAFVKKFNEKNKSKGKLFSVVKLKDLPCFGKRMKKIVNKKRKLENIEFDLDLDENDLPKNKIKRVKLPDAPDITQIMQKTKQISEMDRIELVKKLRYIRSNCKFEQEYVLPILFNIGFYYEKDFFKKCGFDEYLHRSVESMEKFKNLSFNEFLVLFTWEPLSIVYYREMNDDEIILCVSFHPKAYERVDNPSKDVKTFYMLKTNKIKIDKFKNKDQEDRILNMLKLDGNILENINAQNETLCEAAIKNESFSFIHVKEQTKHLCELAIDEYPGIFRYVKNKTNEICERVMKKSLSAFECAPKEFLTKENVSKLIDFYDKKQHCSNLYFCDILNRSEPLSDDMVIKIIIEHEVYMLNLSEHVLNQNIIKNVLAQKSDMDGLNYIKKMNKGDIQWVLERNGRMIKGIENPNTKQMETAIKQNPLALEHIKPQKQTLDLCKLAFSLDKNSIKYAQKQDETMCKEAFEYDPSLIVYLKHQTKEMCEKAIELNVDYYNQLKYKTDKVNMVYLKKYPNQVEHITSLSCEIKKMLFEIDQSLIRYFEDQPIDMVNVLLKNDPLKLKHINQRNKKMENECFLRNMDVFPYIIEKNEEMIVKALEHNSMFLKYVENQTKDHIELATTKDSRCIAFVKD